MPSLPTSLLVVLLAVAWLVVLVPMVAKRREHVPENEEEGARLRVLQRNSAGRRQRRPIISRTAMARASAFDGDEEDEQADLRYSEVSGAAEGVERGGDDGGRGDGGYDRDVRPGAGARDGDARQAGVRDAGDRDDGQRGDGALSDAGGAAGTRVSRYDAVQADRRRGGESGGGRDSRGWDGRMSGGAADSWDGDGDRGVRRVPIRPGRGGYDPVASDRARAYRFRQRRRVALVLLLVVVGGAAAGLWGAGLGYAAAVTGGVVLVLYLAYLRRQVRIEDAIRRRRAERLDRARQIRPGYRPSVAEQVYMHRTGEQPQGGAVADYQVKSHARQSVPPTGLGYGEPVDLEDSDPAFDDLEYYRPASYSRRAG